MMIVVKIMRNETKRGESKRKKSGIGEVSLYSLYSITIVGYLM